ncbi:hypothetical protein [Rugamonas sp.]|uniref:hypothetical protein n=1 Tax=Rugamonas sp. TaxID=1926287 RepID=UPI0025DDD030|nr:hypothetical protein [Rugamonas sp.]
MDQTSEASEASGAAEAAEAFEALQRAWQALEEERYDDALREHLWLHEEGPNGMRLSYALDGWTRLAAVYPAAHAALDEVRGRAAAQLLAGSGDQGRFDEYEAINRHLDEEHLTSTLFVELDQLYPELAALCARRALPTLVKNGECQLARHYYGVPADYLAAQAARLNNAPRRDAEKVHRVEMRAMIEISNYCMAVNLLLETLRGVGESGDEIKAAALALPDSEDLRRDVRRELASPGTMRDEMVAAEIRRAE